MAAQFVTVWCKVRYQVSGCQEAVGTQCACQSVTVETTAVA
jgi:hypothetical protein